MSSTPDPATLTAAQRAELGSRLADQEETLASIHQLEAVLGAPAPGREQSWRDNVSNALAALEEATATEQRNADAPDSLLSDLARTQPRLRNRVRGLRAQYAQVRNTIVSLHHELSVPDHTPDFEDIRRRVAWLLTALRHQRGRESDLIYEAYYDAFNTDIETEKPPT